VRLPDFLVGRAHGTKAGAPNPLCSLTCRAHANAAACRAVLGAAGAVRSHLRCGAARRSRFSTIAAMVQRLLVDQPRIS
jgi:hypothetical protein